MRSPARASARPPLLPGTRSPAPVRWLAPVLALLTAGLVAACGAGDGEPRAEEAPDRSPDPDSLPAWCRALPRPAYDTLRLTLTSEDGWFRVYRIRPGVHAIYEPHQFQEVISYLVEGRERALLFDTGMGIAPIRPVVERLTELPVTVLNSHTHPDHVGGNHEFERVLGIDSDYSRRRALEGFSNERMQGQVAPDALCRPLPPTTERSTYRVEPWSISGTVQEGRRIDLGGRILEILHIPGHTPDAAALLDRERGLLFTGDSFYEGPIYLFGEATDLEAYRASVDRLASLAPRLELLLPGHNTPASPPRMLLSLDEALSAATRGRVEGEPRGGGRVEYVFEDFTLLMRDPGRQR